MVEIIEIKVDRDYLGAILVEVYKLKGSNEIQVRINLDRMDLTKKGHVLVTDGDGVFGFVELRIKKREGSTAVFNFRENPMPKAIAKTHRRPVIPFTLKKRGGQEVIDTEWFFLVC